MASIIFTVKVDAQILLSEDFESEILGNVSTTVGDPIYQFGFGTGCGASDIWDIDNDDNWEYDLGGGAITTWPYVSGNYAEIDNGVSGCSADEYFVIGPFTVTQNNFDLSFDYAFRDFDATSGFIAYAYNDNTSSYETTIETFAGSVGGTHTENVACISGNTYYLIFRYFDTWGYGAALDNIVVQHDCAPSATFTQNCASDLSYSVDVNISNLNGNTSADISSGGTTYFSGVGVGTHTVTGLSGSATVSVISTDNSSCFLSNSFSACDPCTSGSAPSDEPCAAPSIDLSQGFYGSTACGYTVSGGGDGPDDFCGSSDNDSWLKFTATADTVKLDWETIYDAVDCDRGVQYSVFDGSCGSQDAMTSLACFNPPAAFQGTGRFTIPDGSFGSVPLTVGDEYYIYIDGYAGDLCTYSWTPVEGVAVLPPNDLCPDTARIECGESDIQSIILATATDAPAACGAGTPGKGVWYVVDGQGNDITVSTDNGGTNFDTQLNIYTGSCGSFTCLSGDDDSGTGTTSELTFTASSGTTYYIYVDGDGAAEGQFELSLSCIACPANAGTWD